MGANAGKQLVVAAAMDLEKKAQVQQRLLQHFFAQQHQRNQQAADASIAVQKWVDRLELHMRERGLDQRRVACGHVVQKIFQLGDALRNVLGRRRYQGRRIGARAADPVLDAPVLAGRLAGTAP